MDVGGVNQILNMLDRVDKGPSTEAVGALSQSAILILIEQSRLSGF